MSCKIIAEVGVNHNGDFALAKRLIAAGAATKADYVKFQTFVPENLVTRAARKAVYQARNTQGETDSQLEMLRKLALPESLYGELINVCREVGTRFLSTPFDFHSIDFLARFDIDFWKVPSGELTNLPYLRKIAAMGRPIVLSTGMASLDEVGWAIEVLLKGGLKSLNDLTVLHCTTQYPTPMEDVNLNAMLTLREKFGVKVGYSDHTRGIEIPVAAVALGACVIEKHFTLDRNLPGPDQKASLEPAEFAEMVRAIRNVERALGDGVKIARVSERENISVARKSLVASRPICAGERFSEDNVTVKRPGVGLSPMLWDEVMGAVAKRHFDTDELIEL